MTLTNEQPPEFYSVTTIRRILQARKGARVVELARLESVCTGNGTAGSNPALSAV